MDKAIMFNIL